MEKKADRIAIIDGNSLVFRAYYAIRNPMITSKGIYTQAVYGFLNMLQKIMTDAEPDYIAIAFDRKAPTFRHLEYDQYKAGRKKTPSELSMQLPYLKDVLEAMNITILEIDGFEADDIIGTVAKKAEEEGLEPLIITGDRDALQLVSEKTYVMITKKGISEFEWNTPDSIREKYGFGPELFVDYKGLMGDSSDNIPGLPGVGEKTAAKLIIQYGAIENIIANVDNVTPEKLRLNIEENQTIALMSKSLATIVTNVPIDIDIEQMKIKDWDTKRLAELYTELEFRSMLKKLSEKAVDQGESTELLKTVDVDLSQYNDTEISIIDNTFALVNIEEKIKNASEIVLSVLGSDDHVDDPLISAIYIMTTKELYCIKAYGNDDLVVAVAKMLKNCGTKVIGYGLQADIYKLRAVLNASSDRDDDYLLKIEFDASVAHYLLSPNTGNSTIAQIAMTYAGFVLPEPPDFSIGMLAFTDDDLAEYGKSFCISVRLLMPLLRQKLKETKQEKLFDDVEIPLISTLAEMEINGFMFAPSALTTIAADITARIDELSTEIIGYAGSEFNINSPKQLGDVLFDNLGLKGGKKNKNGYSTSADILEKLKDEHPIISLVLEYRTLVKLKGTYIDGLPVFACKDGKIRAHLRQTVTATGRLSCTDPNLQNIPIRQEPGRSLRKAFVPENDEYILMGADYSQIELRVLAHLSEDASLIEDFTIGADIHKRTAARVFGVVDENDVTSEQRGNAKAVNFGIVYGMSSFGLSEELSISVRDASRYINDYFDKHRAVKVYLDSCIEEVKEKGYSTTLMGRIRPIPEINDSKRRQFGERLAMNSPVQGSAADIIKVAMNKVYARLSEEKLESKLILQVHDELILQVKKGEEKIAAEILKTEMENAVTLKVPLVAEIKTGANWYELK